MCVRERERERELPIQAYAYTLDTCLASNDHLTTASGTDLTEHEIVE